ncbi:MAG TPA: hypothetical protein PK156_46900 [Polyangium sp.]|nr:hypothetical protein [Polyangium sp.]
MNLRTFTMVSAVAMLALGGCIIETTNGTGGSAGTGNTGNEGGTGNTGNMGGGGSGNTGNMGGAGGSGGGAPACVNTCAEAASDPTTTICATDTDTSAMLYNDLRMCTCMVASTATPPGCMDKCTAPAGGTPDLCDGAAMPSAGCSTCVFDTVGGCGNQFAACSNDAP